MTLTNVIHRPVLQLKEAFRGLFVRADLAPFMERLADTPLQQALRIKLSSAINGEDFECEPSVLDDFYETTMEALSTEESKALVELFELGVGGWPFVAVWWNGRLSSSSSFYPDEQQGTEFHKRLKDSQRFWDIYSPGITLHSFGGRVFDDDADLLPMVQWYYGDINATTAQEMIDSVQEKITNYSAIGYDFPLWSLNAAAIPAYDSFCPQCKCGNCIIMGDGVTMFHEAYDLDGAGPDALFFHEFSHHIQIAMNFTELNIERTPELTRYIELMADALAAYFAHHPRGASFQAKRILDLLENVYTSGDCYFDNTYHHGTPNQRKNAAVFAINLVDEVKGKGKILKAAEFKALFDAAYPSMVAPDKVV